VSQAKRVVNLHGAPPDVSKLDAFALDRQADDSAADPQEKLDARPCLFDYPSVMDVTPPVDGAHQEGASPNDPRTPNQ
jgi:hypothetical protein